MHDSGYTIKLKDYLFILYPVSRIVHHIPIFPLTVLSLVCYFCRVVKNGTVFQNGKKGP
jgi:hypothetical protein